MSRYTFIRAKRVNFLFLRTNTDSVKGRLSIAIDEFSKTEGRRHVNMASTHGQLTNGMDSGMIHTAWQDVQTNEGTNRRGGGQASMESYKAIYNNPLARREGSMDRQTKTHMGGNKYCERYSSARLSHAGSCT